MYVCAHKKFMVYFMIIYYFGKNLKANFTANIFCILNRQYNNISFQLLLNWRLCTINLLLSDIYLGFALFLHISRIIMYN